MAQKCVFVVSGRGAFPFDMLRYDRCYPYTSADVARLTTETGQREITLIGEAITPERWSSFLWRVLSSKAVK